MINIYLENDIETFIDATHLSHQFMQVQLYNRV